METVVRNVRDLNVTDRSAFERVVGHALVESQRLIIQIVGKEISSGIIPTPVALPEWCNVYEGLSDSEIDDLGTSIVRSHSFRSMT